MQIFLERTVTVTCRIGATILFRQDNTRRIILDVLSTSSLASVLLDPTLASVVQALWVLCIADITDFSILPLTGTVQSRLHSDNQRKLAAWWTRHRSLVIMHRSISSRFRSLLENKYWVNEGGLPGLVERFVIFCHGHKFGTRNSGAIESTVSLANLVCVGLR